MTISAHWGIKIACLGCLSVHAIQGPGIIIWVTFLAGCIKYPGQLTAGLVINRRVRVSCDVSVAGLAFNTVWAVDGCLQLICIDIE